MGEFMEEPRDMQDELDGVEEDSRDYEVTSVNDHVIILVDARRNMFESMSEHGQTCFDAAIQMATRLMKTKIVESRTSQIGVTLFGTKGKSDDGQDITESCIEIQLFHMKIGGAGFDPNKFYLEILASDGDEFNEQALGDGTGATLELLDRVRRREYKKRTLSQLPFYVCEGLQGRENQTKVSFDVKVYTMIYPTRKMSPISLDARRNKPVQVISKYMDGKTGAQLDEHEIRRYFDFCGERAYVTVDEIISLKAVSGKGLVLMGFKELGTLRNDFSIRSPYFIYPDEDGMTGSAKAFIALHTAMLKKGVYGLARLTVRDKAGFRMVALLPQEEEVEDGLQISPPGLHVVLLPFADEIREAKTVGSTEFKREEVPEKATPAAEALIRALQLDGLECHRFDNPVLQRQYAAIQAIALAEEEVSWDAKKDDNTRPDDEGIDAATAGLVEDFNEALGGGEEDDAPPPGTKRRAAGGASGAKRVKVEGNSDDIDWKTCVATGEINGMVVATLKAYLKAQGLATSGKKADLVERIRLHVASR